MGLWTRVRQMRVAVVVPCFNDGRFLKEALASVAEQEPCELVVVDDGSDDPETLAVLDSLRNSGTRVVSQSNSGLGPARMAGVRATDARYVHPLDSDDKLPPGSLTLLADSLDANPEMAAAWGTYRTFGIRECHFPTAPRLDPWRITYIDEIPGVTMLRREAIEAVGGWDHIGYEDWDFWLKMAEHGYDGIGLPQTTYRYREHETTRLLADTMSEFDRHYGILRERHRDLFRARRSNWRKSKSSLGVKLLLPAIFSLPGVTELKKWQFSMVARYMFEKEMSSDCYRGPGTRLRGALPGIARGGK